LQNTTASPITVNVPSTTVCWFMPAALTAQMNLILVEDGGGSYNALVFDGANNYGLGDNKIVQDMTGKSCASSTTIAAANTWNHAACVNRTTSDRSVYLNGGGRGNSAVLHAGLPTWTRIGVGSNPGGAAPINGRIAEAAFWDIDLTDAEILALARGVSPLLVRPANLAGYWPLVGRGAEVDLIGNLALTITGTMAQAAHVPLWDPVAAYLPQNGLLVPARTVTASQSLALDLTAAADADVAATANQSLIVGQTASADSDCSVAAAQTVALAQTAASDGDVRTTTSQSIALAQAAAGDDDCAATAAQTLALAQTAAVDGDVRATAAQSLSLSQTASADVDVTVGASQSIVPVQTAVATATNSRTVSAAQALTVGQAAAADADVQGSASQAVAVAQNATAAASNSRTVTTAQTITLTQTGVAAARVAAIADHLLPVLASGAAQIRLSAAAVQTLALNQVATATQQEITPQHAAERIGITGRGLRPEFSGRGDRNALPGEATPPVVSGRSDRGLVRGRTNRPRLTV
jgi:hypothetical protein